MGEKGEGGVKSEKKEEKREGRGGEARGQEAWLHREYSMEEEDL